MNVQYFLQLTRKLPGKTYALGCRNEQAWCGLTLLYVTSSVGLTRVRV